MPRTLFDHLDLGTGTLHEFSRFKPDILIPEVAGNLIGDSPWLSREIGCQLAGFFHGHQIFTDIEGPLRDPFRLLIAREFRVFAFQHQAATGGRDHHIVPFGDQRIQ